MRDNQTGLECCEDCGRILGGPAGFIQYVESLKSKGNQSLSKSQKNDLNAYGPDCGNETFHSNVSRSTSSTKVEKTINNPWPNGAMNILLFGTGLLPVIGIIAGLIGLFKPATKAQGIALLGFGIGTAIMFGIVTPVGGLIFGIGFACLLVLMPVKICPDCGAALPKFRLPQKNQALRGGWICPDCRCEIDRKGNKIKSGINNDSRSASLQNPVNNLAEKRRTRMIWGWVCLIPGVLMTILMVLVYFFPGTDDSGKLSRLSLESLLISSSFFVICLVMPGLFLLSRAKSSTKKCGRKGQTLSRHS